MRSSSDCVSTVGIGATGMIERLRGYPTRRCDRPLSPRPG
jgi:hypothetical protein